MKNLFKRLFVPFLASTPVSTMAHKLIGNGIPVFMVHRVESFNASYSGISTAQLRRCLDYLVKKNFRFVSLKSIIHALRNNEPLPEKSIAFTMDDGFADQAEIAAPIFLEYNCPITFFIITDMINHTVWPWDAQIAWLTTESNKRTLDVNIFDESLSLPLVSVDDRRQARYIIRDIMKEVDAKSIPEIMQQLGEAAGLEIPDNPPDDFRLMTWDQARKLETQGVCFAPHSKTHRILSKLDKQSAADEIRGSWQTIQQQLSNPLPVFCYPTGRKLDFGPREINILKDEGFIGAMSTIPGTVRANMTSDRSIFSLPRFELPDSMIDFIQYSSWIEYSRGRS